MNEKLKGECYRCRGDLTLVKIVCEGRVYCSKECMEFQKTLDKTELIGEFHNRYSEGGRIEIIYGQLYDNNSCSICKSNTFPMLTVDQNDGEYSPGIICMDCIKLIASGNYKHMIKGTGKE